MNTFELTKIVRLKDEVISLWKETGELNSKETYLKPGLNQDGQIKEAKQ